MGIVLVYRGNFKRGGSIQRTFAEYAGYGGVFVRGEYSSTRAVELTWFGHLREEQYEKGYETWLDGATQLRMSLTPTELRILRGLE